MYREYEAFLKEKLDFAWVTVMICMTVAVVVLIIAFAMKIGKQYKIISALILVSAIVCSILFITPYQKDLSEDALVEYSGELEVEEVFRGRGTPMRAVLTFSNGESVRFSLYDTVELSPGRYHARVLYSEHTKYLFEFENLE